MHTPLITDISIIIPVGPKDSIPLELIDTLRPRKNSEIIVVLSENHPESGGFLTGKDVQILTAPQGRAHHLNTGARHTTKNYLWFVHADSQINRKTLISLHDRLMKDARDSLYFFNLRFFDGNPLLMSLTTLGTWLRSHLFRMPFGDQGLLTHRDVYTSLDGFDPTLAYGEDHDFVWRVHLSKFQLKSISGSIFTSARKYTSRGWLQTTALHIKLTWTQALPYIKKLLQK